MQNFDITLQITFPYDNIRFKNDDIKCTYHLFIVFLLSTINNCFVSLHLHPMFYIAILITIVLVACLIKNYFVITYLLDDEYELSLVMLIRVKRIYNFSLIHASFVMLSHVFTIILHHFLCILSD